MCRSVLINSTNDPFVANASHIPERKVRLASTPVCLHPCSQDNLSAAFGAMQQHTRTATESFQLGGPACQCKHPFATVNTLLPLQTPLFATASTLLPLLVATTPYFHRTPLL